MISIDFGLLACGNLGVSLDISQLTSFALPFWLGLMWRLLDWGYLLLNGVLGRIFGFRDDGSP